MPCAADVLWRLLLSKHGCVPAGSPGSQTELRRRLLRNVNSSIGSGTRNRRFTLPTAAVGGRSSRGENQSALGSYCSARRHVVRCVFEEIVLLQGDACKLFVPSLRVRVRVRAMTNSPMIHCCLLCSMALPTIFGVWSACWLRGFEQVLGMVRIRACNRCVSAHLCTYVGAPPPIFYEGREEEQRAILQVCRPLHILSMRAASPLVIF